MIGRTPLERARVREAERIAELGLLLAIATIFQNTSPFFAGHRWYDSFEQRPSAAA